MFTKPQAEHAWLAGMAGSWDFNSTCEGEPGQPAMVTRGRVTAKTLGGLWLVIESVAKTPGDGVDWSSIMTVGFDPAKGRYVGTFIGSMMSHLWVYEGATQVENNRLVLDVEGPQMEGHGSAKYQDILEVVSPDHWVLKSQKWVEGKGWQPFMESHHHRSGV